MMNNKQFKQFEEMVKFIYAQALDGEKIMLEEKKLKDMTDQEYIDWTFLQDIKWQCQKYFRGTDSYKRLVTKLKNIK